MSDESAKKETEIEKIIALRAMLEKELAALLAHPLVPDGFKKIFENK